PRPLLYLSSFTVPPPPSPYPLSLHDALPIYGKLDDQAPIADVYLLLEHGNPKSARVYPEGHHMGRTPGQHPDEIANTIVGWLKEDRKSTRLNSSHEWISYAVFCLKKKTNIKT